jgi:hypothetical protein
LGGGIRRSGNQQIRRSEMRDSEITPEKVYEEARKPGIQEECIENEGSVPVFLASLSLFRGSGSKGARKNAAGRAGRAG